MTRPGASSEIACDESGFAGGNLVGTGHSPVFAHASVRLDHGSARSLVDHVHRAIGAKGGEYKSAELMRPRHRAVLHWLLDRPGPLSEVAHVHLIDTRLFVLARVVDVLLGPGPVLGSDTPGQSPESKRVSLALYRGGEPAYGSELWQRFLIRAGNLFRTNNRWLPERPVDLFFDTLDQLAARGPSNVSAVITRLQASRPVAEATRSALQSERARTPLMEPLIPAVLRTVEVWGTQSTSIMLVHDEQSALTRARIAEITSRFAARHPGHELTGVRLVDSRQDARIQIADFLAGVAARLAADQLRRKGDPELIPRLRPLVDRRSVWTEPFTEAGEP